MDKKQTINLGKEDYVVNEHTENTGSEGTGKYPNYPYEGYPKPIYDLNKGNSWGSFICGIMSVVFCLTPIFPILMSIIGLFLAHEDKKHSELSPKQKSSPAVVGTILSVFGLIINIVMYIITIILLIICGTFLYNNLPR